MTEAAALVWLATGLLVLSGGRRLAQLLPLRLPAGTTLGLRALALGCALLAAYALSQALSPALAAVAGTLLAMSALSVAVVVWPLGPRAFACTLPLAALVASLA